MKKALFTATLIVTILALGITTFAFAGGGLGDMLRKRDASCQTLGLQQQVRDQKQDGTGIGPIQNKDQKQDGSCTLALQTRTRDQKKDGSCTLALQTRTRDQKQDGSCTLALQTRTRDQKKDGSCNLPV